MLFDLCLCVGSVAQRDKASDNESEESRFESCLFFQRIKKTSVMLLPNLAMNFRNVRTRMLEHEARESVKVLSLLTSR